MTEQDDLFIVRGKLNDGAWWYWANPYIDDVQKHLGRKGNGWHKPERLEDYDHLILKLEDARKFVQDQMKFGLVPWHHYQIRPWFCDSNDPRIEDYPLYPEPVPEVLIVVEGGLVQDMYTTLPKLNIFVIDRDASFTEEHALTGLRDINAIKRLVSEAQEEFEDGR